MEILGLDHRGIRTAKLEESRYFYEELLGLKSGPRPAALATNGYWLYAGESPIVHLIEDAEHAADDTSQSARNWSSAGGQTHLALTVAGARDAVDRLVKAEVPYWDRLFKDPVMYQVFTEDPNGNLIELIDREPGEIDGPICKIVD